MWDIGELLKIMDKLSGLPFGLFQTVNWKNNISDIWPYLLNVGHFIVSGDHPCCW